MFLLGDVSSMSIGVSEGSDAEGDLLALVLYSLLFHVVWKRISFERRNQVPLFSIFFFLLSVESIAEGVQVSGLETDKDPEYSL